MNPVSQMKRMFLKLMILFFFTLASTPTLAQVQVSDLEPRYQEYKFPSVQSNDKKIAEKINTWLQLTHLEIVPGMFKKHPFEKIAFDSTDCCASVDFYKWDKFSVKTDKILSLAVHGIGTGAYSEDFVHFENFDLTTGNPIVVSDLFSQDGLRNIGEVLDLKVRREIRNFLVELKNNVNDKTLSDEHRELSQHQIDLYEDCLDHKIWGNIRMYEMYFSADSIYFERGRCSNHAMRAMDDLYTFKNSFKITQIQDLLSDYGKFLLLPDSKKVEYKSSPQGKVYKGTINKSRVTALVPNIDTDDHSLNIYYWYDRYRIPIEWSGKLVNDEFILSEGEYEEVPNWSPLATINAKWSNGKIIGTWTNTKTREVYKLELEEY